MPQDIKTVIRDNVRALLGLEEGVSGVQSLINKGVSNGNAQRVLGGVASVGIDTIAQVAAAPKVKPWQLLVPGLDPDNLPAELAAAMALHRSMRRAASKPLTAEGGCSAPPLPH